MCSHSKATVYTHFEVQNDRITPKIHFVNANLTRNLPMSTRFILVSGQLSQKLTAVNTVQLGFLLMTVRIFLAIGFRHSVGFHYFFHLSKMILTRYPTRTLTPNQLVIFFYLQSKNRKIEKSSLQIFTALLNCQVQVNTI